MRFYLVILLCLMVTGCRGGSSDEPVFVQEGSPVIMRDVIISFGSPLDFEGRCRNYMGDGVNVSSMGNIFSEKMEVIIVDRPEGKVRIEYANVKVLSPLKDFTYQIQKAPQPNNGERLDCSIEPYGVSLNYSYFVSGSPIKQGSFECKRRWENWQLWNDSEKSLSVNGETFPIGYFLEAMESMIKECTL